MIEAVIFDMDGLLIDSEPFWRQAEMTVFGSKDITLSEKDCMETTGLRIEEVVAYWQNRFPDVDLNKALTSKEILEEVTRLVKLNGKALPGVYEIIRLFKNKNIKLAIASGSNYSLINTVVEKLSFKSEFDILQSAENLLLGKPHPEIFLKTASKLNVAPEKCLVLEDSINGLIAAKAAKMKCLAIPEQHNLDRKEYAIADMVLPSLKDFSENEFQKLIK